MAMPRFKTVNDAAQWLYQVLEPKRQLLIAQLPGVLPQSTPLNASSDPCEAEQAAYDTAVMNAAATLMEIQAKQGQIDSLQAEIDLLQPIYDDQFIAALVAGIALEACRQQNGGGS